MVSDLPSVFEAFSDRKHCRDRSGVDSSGKSRHSSKVPHSSFQQLTIKIKLWLQKLRIQLLLFKLHLLLVQRGSDGHVKNSRTAAPAAKQCDDDDDEDDEEHTETFCGTCGGLYNSNEFWIGCDICERWFHGKCVRITPARADHIKHYKCPDCSSKKMRQ